MPPAIRAVAGERLQRSMERGPTQEWVILRIRPRNFGGRRHDLSLSLRKRTNQRIWFKEAGEAAIRRIPLGSSLTMLRSLGLFALIACAIALVWHGLGRPAAMPPSPLGPGEKLTCISYAPFHGDQAPFTVGSPHSRRADRRGFAAPLGAHLLRPDLFGQGGAGADHAARRGPRPQGAARHLARSEPRRQSPGDRGGAEARPPPSRHGQGSHRRQRDAAQGRARSRDGRDLSRGGQAALGTSRHLCRCLGVLAQVARARLGGRLHHHPYPPLLGGRSGERERRRRPCAGGPRQSAGGLPRQGDLDRRGGLAERRTDARRGAPLPGQPGARS